MITAFGVVAAVTMVVAYALEARGRRWVAIFAVGCFAASVFGVVTGAWVFAGLEAVWGVVAVHRFRRATDHRDRASVHP